MISKGKTELVNIHLDGKEVEVPAGMNLIEAVALHGKEVPHYCYHPHLSIAGNCRMCLVEMGMPMRDRGTGEPVLEEDGSQKIGWVPKPVIGCGTNVAPGMHVNTQNEMVDSSREAIMEFLLVNHPLDCPVCDQGGECDLQDITLTFGSERGRFYEYSKRSVDSFSSCAPFIKTVMTRCIHCTRCVRFLKEVSGVFDLGVLGRGNSMEIGTYINRFVNDELSGNIIDLCPVGALTSMPYAFHKRSWENDRIESIDIIDSLASSVRFDVVEDKIVRILPGLDENVNGE